MLVSPVDFDGHENLKNRERNIQSISFDKSSKTNFSQAKYSKVSFELHNM